MDMVGQYVENDSEVSSLCPAALLESIGQKVQIFSQRLVCFEQMFLFA